MIQNETKKAEKDKIKDNKKSSYTEKMKQIIEDAMDEADMEGMLKDIKELQINELKTHQETIKNFFISYIKNGQRINQNTRDYLYIKDPDLWELIDDITKDIKNTINDAENQKAKQEAKGTLKPKVYFKDPLKTQIYNIYLDAFKEFYKLT